MVTPLVAACSCPTFVASVSSVPIAKPLILLLFKLAPPFNVAIPATVRAPPVFKEPALIAPVEVTVVKLGLLEVAIVISLPLRVISTLLPFLNLTVSLDLTADAVSLLA